MVLRLIEIVLPKEKSGDLEVLLKGEGLPILGMWMQPVLGVWERPVRGVLTRSFAENQILVKVLLSTEDTERVLDLLETRFSKVEGFRIVLLQVQASLPRPEEIEDKRPASAKRVNTVPEEVPSNEALEEAMLKAKRSRISREELYADVTKTARLSRVYIFMVALSSIVAAIGVIRDNVAIIIGAMVIAPLLGPNVALSLATTLGDTCLAQRALKASLVGIITAITLSFFLGSILNVDPSASEIASRTTVGLAEVAVALAAGSAGALAFTSGISTSLIGVMVAVALLPPLVTFGLLMGSGHESLAIYAMLLFIINLISVNLAGVVTFLIQGIRPTGWMEAKRAKRTTYAALLLWMIMLAALVIIILISQKV
jgi:uncharacterized hydrophobic protein (TIGR00341 family)